MILCLPELSFPTEELELSRICAAPVRGCSPEAPGMDGARELFISAVAHQTLVDVDEHGTEAAAATAVGLRCLGRAPSAEALVPCRADHPFLFLIRDTKVGERRRIPMRKHLATLLATPRIARTSPAARR